VSILTNELAVSDAEKARRMAEYRKLGFERRAPAQVVYQEPHVLCPWPGCGLRIDGIHFQLDRWLDKSQLDTLLAAWWKGPGLVGKCPKCRNLVLFAVEGKSTVTDETSYVMARLADHWAVEAHIVTRA
jgi:hypothetical protein